MEKEQIVIKLRGDKFVIDTDKKNIPTDVVEQIINEVAAGLCKMWHKERKNYKTIIFIQTISVLILFIGVIAMYLK